MSTRYYFEYESMNIVLCVEIANARSESMENDSMIENPINHEIECIFTIESMDYLEPLYKLIINSNELKMLNPLFLIDPKIISQLVKEKPHALKKGNINDTMIVEYNGTVYGTVIPISFTLLCVKDNSIPEKDLINQYIKHRVNGAAKKIIDEKIKEQIPIVSEQITALIVEQINIQIIGKINERLSCHTEEIKKLSEQLKKNNEHFVGIEEKFDEFEERIYDQLSESQTMHRKFLESESNEIMKKMTVSDNVGKMKYAQKIYEMGDYAS